MARRHLHVAASAPAYDRYGTMDPSFMRWMAGQVQHGRYLDCPQGSHLAMYDDQRTYMDGVIGFIKDVDTGAF